MLFRLSAIPNVQLFVNAPLARYTRFEIGGPARMLANVSTSEALAETLQLAKSTSTPHAIIGGGTNLIVDDKGFPGVVIRYVAKHIEILGTEVRVEAGALLQDLVDKTIEAGLKGLETMTGIPGWVGGAIYGNAGAYGHSIQESIVRVRFFDGTAIRELESNQLDFSYRSSIFKSCKAWVVLDAVLKLKEADPAELRATAEGILKIRNEKYPPTMRCAGSIFKNLMLADLPQGVTVPDKVVREGKVPSAYFLEAAGAKGLAIGGLRVADYHANLIYNEGGGTARDLWHLIETLKAGVQEKFGVKLEEEVQSIGPQ
ncbi:MAG TPA: UDP-N-acetylmuramate dehydrogenase [Bryobacteraceae bacterium]|jgi:UDP-N-acetylmuramate dehydrogenase|nr:UDP-N-acetylmuramate dehydrogenase [Bryobacteraceae bacterium]